MAALLLGSALPEENLSASWHWEGYHALRLVHRQSPFGNASAGEAFSFSEIDVRAPAYHSEGGGVYLGFVRRLWRLEVPENGDPVRRRWDAVHVYEAALGAALVTSDRWAFYGEWTPNVSGTRVRWESGSIRHGALVVASRTVASDRVLFFGVGALGGYLDWFPYPLLGANWRFAPGWAFDVLLPSYAFVRWRCLPGFETGWRLQLLELEARAESARVPAARALTVFHVETGPYAEARVWRWIWLRLATGLPVYRGYYWADRAWAEVRPLPRSGGWLVSAATRIVF